LGALVSNPALELLINHRGIALENRHEVSHRLDVRSPLACSIGTGLKFDLQ
jgi:hypothetical protein